MNTRQLGTDGPHLTEIGLGAWAIGGPWAFGWGEQDDAESIRTIHAALEGGINWIDTAAVYGLGHGETVVGEAIRGRRKDVFVATKCGLVWDADGQARNNNRPESIRRECEASLKRLGIDHIDLYQIHWPDGNVPVEESWGEMSRLQEEGKVRYIGVSNFDRDLLARCEPIRHVNSLQPPYSLVNRDYENEVFPWCRENGVGIVAYSPIMSGLLTEKFTKDHFNGLPADDWRKRSNHFAFREPVFSAARRLVEGMKPIAAKYDRTVSDLAIAWVRQQPGVTSAIVGARTVAQATRNLAAADWTIEKGDLEAIEALYQETIAPARGGR